MIVEPAVAQLTPLGAIRQIADDLTRIACNGLSVLGLNTRLSSNNQDENEGS